MESHSLVFAQFAWRLEVIFEIKPTNASYLGQAFTDARLKAAERQICRLMWKESTRFCLIRQGSRIGLDFKARWAKHQSQRLK